MLDPSHEAILPNTRVRRRSLMAVCAIALAWTSNGRAEVVAHASQLLENDVALRGWLRNHQPQILAARARVREAQAGARDARLIPNPVLTLGVAGITFGDRRPSTLSASDTQNYQVTLAETVEIGKRQHRIRAAEHHVNAAEADKTFVEAALVADARDELAKLVYLRARLRVLEERLQSARGIVELDQSRLEQGDVSGIDHRRLMLDVVNVERELAENATDLASAQAACAAALGSICEGDLPVDRLDSLATMPAGVPTAPAAASRPDIVAQREEAESHLEQAALQANRAIPDPQVGLSYLHDNLVSAGNQPNTFGVFVAIPLPLSDRGQHQREQELGRAEQFSAEARRLELNAVNDARSLATAERVLADKLKMLKERAIPLGAGVLESTERAYRLGQVSMTDLLLARRQRGELALDLVDTSYSLFQTRNQLRRVLGLDVAKD